MLEMFDLVLNLLDLWLASCKVMSYRLCAFCRQIIIFLNIFLWDCYKKKIF